MLLIDKWRWAYRGTIKTNIIALIVKEDICKNCVDCVKCPFLNIDCKDILEVENILFRDDRK